MNDTTPTARKAMRIKMTDQHTGNVFWWTVRYVPHAVNLVTGRKPRKMQGWSYTDHEGCERFSEGNWLALVDSFRITARNYDFNTNIS